MKTGNSSGAPRESVLRHLLQVARRNEPEPARDRDLLEQYAGSRDEASFTALVRRHGPMVFAVCRRLLRHQQDAEDAFQATFLVLARKVDSIRKQDSLASWLYGVAYRLAVRARQQQASRRSHETRGDHVPQTDPQAGAALREFTAALDAELAGLPDALRSALVLCYLEGKTQDEAAARLGWSKSTLRRRLDRGLALLRSRLTRRGLALSAGLLAVAVFQGSAPAAPPAALVKATATAALQFGAGRAAAAVSARAVALAEGGLKTMLLTKLKTVAILLVVLGLAATGVGALAHSAGTGVPPEEARQVKRIPPPPNDTTTPPSPAAEKPPPGTLPAGAVARLGNGDQWFDGQVSLVAFSPDGKLLARAPGDDTIRLVDPVTGKEVRKLSAAGGSAVAGNPQYFNGSGLFFSPDGKTLGLLRLNQALLLWDVDTGKDLPRLEVDPGLNALSVAFSPDGKAVAVGGSKNPPRLFDVATGKELTRLGDAGNVRAVAFAPDGKTVVTGGDDQMVRVWDVATGKEVRVLDGHRNALHGVAVAPDGKTVATVADDATLRLWDPATGKELRLIETGLTQLNLTSTMTSFFRFSGDGKAVLLGKTADRAIRSWDVATGQEQARFEAPRSQTVTWGHLALSPDGKTVAVSGVNSPTRLFDRASGKELEPVPGHRHPVHAVAFAPDGKLLASASADKTVRLWDVATGKEVRVLRGHRGTVSSLAFSPDGKLLASAGNDPSDRVISIWDVANGNEVHRLRGVPGAEGPNPNLRPVVYGFTALAFASDSKTLVSQTFDARLVVWDVTGERSPRVLKPRCTAFAFTPSRKTLVAVNETEGRLLDVLSDEDLGTVPDWSKTPMPSPAAAVSPDGRTLCLLGSDTSVRLLDMSGRGGKRTLPAEGYQQPQILPGGMLYPRPPTDLSQFPYGRPFSVAFSPDGKTVALTSTDSVRLIETASGKERCRLRGHDGSVAAIAFSPNGHLLASASLDTTVVLWDLQAAGRGDKQEAVTEENVKERWGDLGLAEPAKAYRTLVALADAPKVALPFLEENLKATPPKTKDQIAALVKDLDSDEFATRKKAADELERLGEPAREALTKLLETKPSLDLSRRVEGLLQKIDGQGMPVDRLRELRAVEALELMNTPEARKLLEKLAGGDADARLTVEARQSLERLGKK
jgi:RNA polymerase sigma factor (sigma-70 family)